MDTKQVIIIRKDLKMRRGKEIAQACHSSISFLTRRIQRVIDDGRNIIKSLSKAELAWIRSGFAKICLQVNSEDELRDLHQKAKEAGLESHLVIDSGKTEFGGVPTVTCLAIGPDQCDKIDIITGHLKLY